MLLLALALGGPLACNGENTCGPGHELVSLRLDAPGGAALHFFRTIRVEYEWVDAVYLGTASNHGSEPCRLALYRHFSEPRPDLLPVLTAADAAPRTIDAEGELQFETVLPPARDGHVLVRPIREYAHKLEDIYPYGYYVWLDTDKPLRDAWLTIATCSNPDVQLDLEVEPFVCDVRVRPRGSSDFELAWPTP